MDFTYNSIVNKLASNDKLHKWGQSIPNIKGKERRDAFLQATPIWIERMVREGKILLHPDVIDELRVLKWMPCEIHKKMIWASIICMMDAKTQKAERAEIRKIIQKQYGNDWWEDIYSRAGQIWPAWNRYSQRVLSTGPAMQMLSSRTSLFGLGMQEEIEACLRMVPKD